MSKRESAQPTLLETPRTNGDIQHAEIIVQPTVRLGSLVVRPEEVIQKASQVATELAKIIVRRKLFTLISGKKHVWVEGWTTLGAILGVSPIEEFCRPTPDGFGFEAKINLIRTADGQIIGAASSQCTSEEAKWTGRDAFAIRSMAITRATGKAFRLSFAWIMKLAGYEALPAEEAEEDREQRKEAAKAIGEQKTQDLTQMLKAQVDAGPGPTLFCQWPETHNGHYAFMTGNSKVIQTVSARFNTDTKAKWIEEKRSFMVPASNVPLVKEICELLAVKFYELPNPFKTAAAANGK